MVEVENGCCPETRTLSARAKEDAIVVGLFASENAVTFFFFLPLPLDEDVVSERSSVRSAPFFLPSPLSAAARFLSKSTSSCVNNGEEVGLDLS